MQCASCGCTSAPLLVKCKDCQADFCNNLADKVSHIAKHISSTGHKGIILPTVSPFADVQFVCEVCGETSITLLGLAQEVGLEDEGFSIICESCQLTSDRFIADSFIKIMSHHLFPQLLSGECPSTYDHSELSAATDNLDLSSDVADLPKTYCATEKCLIDKLEAEAERLALDAMKDVSHVDKGVEGMSIMDKLRHENTLAMRKHTFATELKNCATTKFQEIMSKALLKISVYLRQSIQASQTIARLPGLYYVLLARTNMQVGKDFFVDSASNSLVYGSSSSVVPDAQAQKIIDSVSRPGLCYYDYFLPALYLEKVSDEQALTEARTKCKVFFTCRYDLDICSPQDWIVEIPEDPLIRSSIKFRSNEAYTLILENFTPTSDDDLSYLTYNANTSVLEFELICQSCSGSMLQFFFKDPVVIPQQCLGHELTAAAPIKDSTRRVSGEYAFTEEGVLYINKELRKFESASPELNVSYKISDVIMDVTYKRKVTAVANLSIFSADSCKNFLRNCPIPWSSTINMPHGPSHRAGKGKGGEPQSFSQKVASLVCMSRRFRPIIRFLLLDNFDAARAQLAKDMKSLIVLLKSGATRRAAAQRHRKGSGAGAANASGASGAADVAPNLAHCALLPRTDEDRKSLLLKLYDLEEDLAGSSNQSVISLLAMASTVYLPLEQQSHANGRIVKATKDAFSGFGVSLNVSQIAAVRRSLGSIVSIIQGPPGCGKSSVCAALCYAFTQVYKARYRADPVLLCCKSNTACNNVTKILMGTSLRVVRVLAPSRESLVDSNAGLDEIRGLFLHNIILGFCRELVGGGSPGSPGGPGGNPLRDSVTRDQAQLVIDHYSKYGIKKDSTSDRTVIAVLGRCTKVVLDYADVVVSTCITSYSDALIARPFSVAIIDECTQADECDALCAIGHQVRQFVLIGDHMQLSTCVSSQLLKRACFDRSLYERLLRLRLDPSLLSTQYRMHPFIALFPSNAFYNSQLDNGVPARDRLLPLRTVPHALSGTRAHFQWVSANRPTFFWDVQGNEERMTTTLCNAAEATAVYLAISSLVGTYSIDTGDIGVVTPYNGQVLMIADELARLLKDDKIEVDTVDSFQGREKDVMILSAVRSNAASDLGFVSDVRRLNVSITRARRGLIIIGNSACLARDPTWRALIEHYEANGLLVTGPDIDTLVPLARAGAAGGTSS